MPQTVEVLLYPRPDSFVGVVIRPEELDKSIGVHGCGKQSHGLAHTFNMYSTVVRMCQEFRIDDRSFSRICRPELYTATALTIHEGRTEAEKKRIWGWLVEYLAGRSELDKSVFSKCQSIKL